VNIGNFTLKKEYNRTLKKEGRAQRKEQIGRRRSPGGNLSERRRRTLSGGSKGCWGGRTRHERIDVRREIQLACR
jgi:hypothetical protein